VRLEAAEALAGLNDGRGWRYLLDAVRDPSDTLVQAAAAEILGELGHPRALPALHEAALIAKDEALEAVQNALEALEGPPPANAGGESVAQPVRQPDDRGMFGSLVGSMAAGEGGYEGQFVDPTQPEAYAAGHIEIHPAEMHLNNAAQLRESEMQERGLVAASLAGWLRPDWAEVWYLRGVLLEDLEREREALLAYRRALTLDPHLSDAREALSELEESVDARPASSEALISDLSSGEWRSRRDALAVLDARSGIEPEAVTARLDDEEREVRHAAIEAVSRLRIHSAVPVLLAKRESSWLLRFAIIEALSSLGALDALADRLRLEMARMQERNPIFTSARDPLVEIEYDLLLEIGTLALERTGDVAGLLDQTEGNTWEETGQDDEDDLPYEYLDEDDLGLDEEDYEGEADEDLLSYVDETGLMVAQALERLAANRLPDLPLPLVERLSSTPDLTLLDPADESSQPALVHDFASLRAAAAAELNRRA
jgi:tetratricopeptide (TPR) repeat protein